MEVEKVHLGQSVGQKKTAYNLLLLLTLYPCSDPFTGLSQTISTGKWITAISDTAFQLICELFWFSFSSELLYSVTSK